MDSLGGLLSVALAVIGIATFAGLGLQRGRINDKSQQLRDADETIERLKSRKADADADHLKFKAEAETQIAQLEADLAALRRVVTGEIHLVAIADRLEDAIALLREFIAQHHEDGEP